MQAAILVSLVNDLLDISSVRHEIDKREAAGQWVAGKGGAGGSFPMRSDEERAMRAEAGSDAEVHVLGCITCKTMLLRHASWGGLAGYVDHMSRAYRLCFLITLVGHKSHNSACRSHAIAVSRKQTCHIGTSWHERTRHYVFCDDRSLLAAKLDDPVNAQAKQAEPGSDARMSLQLLHRHWLQLFHRTCIWLWPTCTQPTRQHAMYRIGQA